MKRYLLCNLLLLAIFSSNIALGKIPKWTEDEITTGFVESNIIWTLLHETGHLLINELDIDVLGSAEDAADNIATITFMNLDLSHDVQTILHIALTWNLRYEKMKKYLEENDEDYPFHTDHRLDQQRAFQIVCVAYGSEPDSVSDLASLIELPKDRQKQCISDYARLERAWNRTLSPYLLSKDENRTKIFTQYHLPKSHKYQYLVDFVRDRKIFETVANALPIHYQVKREIRYEIKQCNRACLSA